MDLELFLQWDGTLGVLRDPVRDYCDEKEIKGIADAMISNGMRDLGYNYINLDDCWAFARDGNGNILADPIRFPNGMKSLADHLHKKGFRFGLYTDSGLQTCSQGERDHSIPGSYGHYQQDATTYAQWGMDLVKMDWCNTVVDGKQLDPKVQYPEMYQSLNSTGRPIFFSLCEWGVDDPWTWASKCGNSWRIGPDHHDNWNSTSEIIENLAGKSKFAGPGGWNDPDFLMTGGEGCKHDHKKICPGQTHTEYKSEFSIWAITNAPLFVATEVRTMNEEKKAIVLNKEIIQVNQDPLSMAGDRITNQACSGSSGVCQIWTKPLQDKSQAVVLYNSDEVEHNITLDFSLIGWENAQIKIRDLWHHEDLGIFSGNFTSKVKSHGVTMIKATKS